jgi:hypothetical protein
MAKILEAVRADEGIQMLAKGELRSQAKLRTIQAQIFDCYIGDAAIHLFANPKAAGTQYFQEARKQGKGHKLGSPHKYQAEKLIETVYSDPGLPLADKNTVEAYAKEFSTVDLLAVEITTLRMGITYAKKARMVIGYSHASQQRGIPAIVRAAIARNGGEWMKGEAPQGHIERELRRLFQIGREYDADV